MKLHANFNLSCLSFLRWLLGSFRDNKSLHNYVSDYMDAFERDKETDEYYKSLRDQLHCHEDFIFAKEEKFIVGSDVQFFKDIDMADMFNRMDTDEREAFWVRFISVCKHFFMLEACGEQTSYMEKIAEKVRAENPNMKPQEHAQRMMEDLFSGGELSRNLVKEFANKESLIRVMDNFPNLMRRPGGEKLDLSMLKEKILTEDLSQIDSQFDEMQSALQESGLKPEDILAKAAEGDTMFSSIETERLGDMLKQLTSKINMEDGEGLDFLKQLSLVSEKKDPCK